MTVPSTLRLTEETPTLSVALTLIFIVPDTDAAFEGEVMLVTGAVTSEEVVVLIFLPDIKDCEDKRYLLLLATKSEETINLILLNVIGSSGATPDNLLLLNG